MINWREKFRAFFIHFLATTALGACAAALIFLVWFPHPFATMIGGTELFVLVMGCDLVLGPLMSLVICSKPKFGDPVFVMGGRPKAMRTWL